MVLRLGIEPRTYALSARCSTYWAIEEYINVRQLSFCQVPQTGDYWSRHTFKYLSQFMPKKRDQKKRFFRLLFYAQLFRYEVLGIYPWWTWRDLNALPSACKADALPDELQAHLRLSLKTTPPQAAISGNLITKVLSHKNQLITKLSTEKNSPMVLWGGIEPPTWRL